jgi:hypothetical protein
MAKVHWQTPGTMMAPTASQGMRHQTGLRLKLNVAVMPSSSLSRSGTGTGIPCPKCSGMASKPSGLSRAFARR